MHAGSQGGQAGGSRSADNRRRRRRRRATTTTAWEGPAVRAGSSRWAEKEGTIPAFFFFSLRERGASGGAAAALPAVCRWPQLPPSSILTEKRRLGRGSRERKRVPARGTRAAEPRGELGSLRLRPAPVGTGRCRTSALPPSPLPIGWGAAAGGARRAGARGRCGVPGGRCPAAAHLFIYLAACD